MMRSRKILMEKFIDPGSKNAAVNQDLREVLMFQVLLDIRELLQDLKEGS